MKRKAARCAGVALAAVLGAGPLPAADGPPLASVVIANVAETIARNTGLESSRIPLTVQVPLAVAAGVCGIAADALVKQSDSGMAQCTAQNSSTELEEVVRQRVQANAGG